MTDTDRNHEIGLLCAFEQRAIETAFNGGWITEQQRAAAYDNLEDWRKLLEKDFDAFKNSPPRLPGWH